MGKRSFAILIFSTLIFFWRGVFLALFSLCKTVFQKMSKVTIIFCDLILVILKLNAIY